MGKSVACWTQRARRPGPQWRQSSERGREPEPQQGLCSYPVHVGGIPKI